MSLLDPLRPYAELARVIGCLLLASVLLFGGCSWGRSIEENKAAERIANKDQALRDAAQSLRDASAALEEVNANTIAEQEAAAERTRQADFAKERALKAADDKRRQMDVLEKELEIAKRDPGCRSELEKPVCASLR